MPLKFIMCPSINSAKQYVEENGQPKVTIEAEYGKDIIQGSLYTSAHHGDKQHLPAPSTDEKIPAISDGTVLLSHIDLDALMGCMRCMGMEIDKEFSEAVEYIDNNGPQHVAELSEDLQKKFNAFYAYRAAHSVFDRSDTPKDVTASVIDNVQMIHSISKDPNLYKNANEFARNGIEENEFKDPVFLSNGVSLDIQQTTHDNFQITGKIEDELLSDYEVSQNNSINTYSNIPKDVLDRFIDNHGGLKSESLYWTEQGEKWHDQIVTNAQNRQYAMTDNLRVFVTEGPPTAAAYETADHQIAPATLTFRMSPEKNADGTPKYVPLQDRVGVITIAFYDGGRSDGGKYSAAEIMQAILGDKAGGKDGIASSPRGENMTFDTFLHVRRQFEDILNGRDIRDVLAENMVNEMEAESRPSNPLDDLDKDCFENAAEKEEYRAFMEEKYDPIICPKPREFEIGKEEKTDI